MHTNTEHSIHSFIFKLAFTHGRIVGSRGNSPGTYCNKSRFSATSNQGSHAVLKLLKKYRKCWKSIESVEKVLKKYWKYWKCIESTEKVTSIEKVLNCEIGFQDLEEVLNLAKMCIKFWKSMEIPNSAICLFKLCTLPLMTVLQMFFALCSMKKIWKN